MKIRNIYFLIFSLSIACCSQDPVERALEKLNLSSPESYKMIDSTYIWGLGESYEQYEIIISEKDFIAVKNQIESNKLFQIIDSNSTEPNLREDKMNIKTEVEIAYLFNNKYCLEKYIPNPGILISVALLRDSVLYINYVDF